MSYPVYYVPAGDVIPHLFATYDGGTGASLTMSGLAVTDIEIYKDGGVTQRASDAGYTLLDTDGIDFDGITGIHGFSIDTGDNTDAGFYTVGAWFHVVVSAITVDAQTVSFVACAFRLMATEGVAGKPKTDVDAFGGTAGTFSSGRPEVNTSHIAGSAVSTSSAQIGVNVVNAGGTAWGSGAITAASIAADAITAAKIATGAIDADAIADNAIDAGAIASDAITSAKIADGAITAAKIADGAIDRATFAADTGLQTVRSNTAQAGAAGTITLDASASATNDFYNGSIVYLTGGTGVGQYRVIYDYDGTTKVASIAPNWATNPDNTSTFAVIPQGSANLETIQRVAVSTTTAQLGVNVVQISTDATAADNCELFFDGTGYAGGTTKLDVNVAQISTDATAADNAEAFFDGTGYAGTNNVIPTVTTLTNKSGFSLDSSEHTNIADALLKRDMSVVSGEAARSPLNALRFLRNKWSISGVTLTVTKEDDSTSAWTSTITATNGADPITASDPA